MAGMPEVRRGSHIVVQSRNARRAISVVAFTALTAFCAHIAFPLPGNLVPVTLQTLAVTLAGAVLGPYLGATAMVMYLALGIAGAPVFAGGVGLAALAGPTGGYLIAFPIAAAVCGLLYRMPRDASAIRMFTQGVVANLLASFVILGVGAAQLSLFIGAERAFTGGVVPFLLGDVIKVVAAALIAMKLRNRTLELL